MMPLKRYTFKLQKTIVVEVEAASLKEAKETAVDTENGHDGAWDRAEVAYVLMSEERL